MSFESIPEASAILTTRLQGKYAEDDLYTLAKHLLYEPNEGDGKAFTQRATKMLTLLWLACLELNRITGKDYRLLPFVGKMADLPATRDAPVATANTAVDRARRRRVAALWA